MRATTSLASTILAFVSLQPMASAQSFTGLGDLAGGAFESFSANLSSDGSLVTGTSLSVNGGEAFLWSHGAGMVGLGTPVGSDSSGGAAVSDDGFTVVGGHNPDETVPQNRAMRWASGTAQDFDPFPAGALGSTANDMSADGTVVVGSYVVGQIGTMAYHWKENVLTMIGVGSANGVSMDGNVVVGGLGDVGSDNEAFRWTTAVGVLGLGDLPGGVKSSTALGMSADGLVVVGESDSTTGREAFRWTEASNMIGLGFLPAGSYSSAVDATADGSIVVGGATTGTDSDPFIWDEAHGMRNLVDVLINDYGLDAELAGWDLIEATAISDNGKVIVGNGINPEGNFEAWRADLVPEPNSALLCSLASTVCLLSWRQRK